MPGHAIVTGGSSGIGLAIALLLARDGLDLTIVARDDARLAAARARLESERRAPDQEFRALSADLADAEAAERATAAAIAAGGAPDWLILSAGIARPGYVGELARADFEAAMRVNYFGTLHPIRAALPAMRARRRGRIVMISSGAGLVGIFGYAAYSPSKFALRGLAEVLRAELRRDGVAVSIAFPPDTDTPQLVAEAQTKPPETHRITRSGGLWQAENVAKAIVRGAAKGRFAITPGWQMTLLYRLGSPLEPLLSRYFDHLARRAR